MLQKKLTFSLLLDKLSRDSIFLVHRTMFWYPFFKPRAGMLTFCCIYLDPIKIDYFRVRVYAWNFCTVFRRAPGLHPFCFMGHCKACCKKLLGSADRIKSSCISSINLPGNCRNWKCRSRLPRTPLFRLLTPWNFLRVFLGHPTMSLWPYGVGNGDGRVMDGDICGPIRPK